MAISWSRKFDSTDDGSLIYGSELGTMQDDIDAGTSGVLPSPGVTDALKIPRVLSDHSGYELVAQVPMAAGGTGADLSVGTAGQVVMSQGTAGNMTLGTAISKYGGTGADLSAGTAGYAVVSQGTASTALAFSPLYTTQEVTFLADSAAQTMYCTSPVTGVVSAVYVNTHVAARGAAYTITVGSAGAGIATATVPSTGVAGQVTTATLGTVAVVAGGSIGVARGVTGTTGASTVTVVIIKTP